MLRFDHPASHQRERRVLRGTCADRARDSISQSICGHFSDSGSTRFKGSFTLGVAGTRRLGFLSSVGSRISVPYQTPLVKPVGAVGALHHCCVALHGLAAVAPLQEKIVVVFICILCVECATVLATDWFQQAIASRSGSAAIAPKSRDLP